MQVILPWKIRILPLLYQDVTPLNFLRSVSPVSLSCPSFVCTLQRHCTESSKQIFSEMKLRGLVPNSYIHVSVSYLYIPRIGLPILLQQNTVGGLILGIYKSLTDTWMWKLGTKPPSFISDSTYIGSSLQCSPCRNRRLSLCKKSIWWHFSQCDNVWSHNRFKRGQVRHTLLDENYIWV